MTQTVATVPTQEWLVPYLGHAAWVGGPLM